MSFRKEEKLLINSNQVFDFKKWMSSKGFLLYISKCSEDLLLYPFADNSLGFIENVVEQP